MSLGVFSKLSEPQAVRMLPGGLETNSYGGLREAILNASAAGAVAVAGRGHFHCPKQWNRELSRLLNILRLRTKKSPRHIRLQSVTESAARSRLIARSGACV